METMILGMPVERLLDYGVSIILALIIWRALPLFTSLSTQLAGMQAENKKLQEEETRYREIVAAINERNADTLIRLDNTMQNYTLASREQTTALKVVDENVRLNNSDIKQTSQKITAAESAILQKVDASKLEIVQELTKAIQPMVAPITSDLREIKTSVKTLRVEAGKITEAEKRFLAQFEGLNTQVANVEAKLQTSIQQALENAMSSIISQQKTITKEIPDENKPQNSNPVIGRVVGSEPNPGGKL